MSELALTEADLETLANNAEDGDEVAMTIRVGDQTDTITLAVHYTSPDVPEVGLALPGDGRQYGKLALNRPGPEDTEIMLVTRAEEQHNADVLEVEA